MGKPVLVSLLAAALFFCCARTGTAQEAEPEPETRPAWSFTPGQFLTADDYEHLKAALDCINLKPEDLNYEKKHRPDDILRLSICDKALDDPLAVPGMAEHAAAAFGVKGASSERFQHTAKVLDAPVDRWSLEQGELDRATRKLLQEKAEAIEKAGDPAKGRATLDKAFEESLFGGEAKQVQEMPQEHADIWRSEMYALGQELYIPLAALHRSQGPELRDTQWRKLVGRIAPGVMAESDLPIPGSEKFEKLEDWFDLMDQSVLFGTLRAADLLLASILAKWVEGYSNIIVREEGDPPAKGPESTVAGVSGGVLAAWQGPLGKVVIGGEGPNTYEGDDFIGIIDLGGDDVYRGRVACGIGLEGKAPISFVLDLSGNDRYEGGDFTQGFGFLGVGILHDLGGGNDYYSAGFCAQGCGLCGYGELYDDGGNDQYRADSGAQGAGCFGYGQLTDVAGNDTYYGARFVQGFAQVMGVGVLTDGAGNDTYYAGGKYLHQPLWNDHYQSLSQGFSIGNRNDAGVGTGGGVALLLDEGDGNDFYSADIYGQGSSYWYSLGFLVDTGGNDVYTLGQYGQGAGIHLSSAGLFDLKGNDAYTMTIGLGQGSAHDWAVGWQIDRAGNDVYQGNGQGMGLNFSVGILLDCAGDDSHSAIGDGSIGKGTNNDISLLLDLAGSDTYGPKEIKDAQFTRRGNHQLVYDVPPGWFPGIDSSTLPTKQDPAPDAVIVQHILISWKGADERVQPKDAERTKEQAIKLRDEVMKQARSKGADWAALQKAHNEDSDAQAKYMVEREKRNFVKSFQDLALSLGKGQIDWCESEFGFHIIKRIE